MNFVATTPAAAIPKHYSISKLPHCSYNLSQLQTWLLSKSPTGAWTGKIYVASTISWNGSDFLQRGCSPNLHAGFWSLTCCMHDMRRAKKFNYALSDPVCPVFVFTLASKHKSLGQGGQALVSVAKVTEHFPDMQAYAKRVNSNTHLRDSRLSRVHAINPYRCWRFGDCHSDSTGAIGQPLPSHVHAPAAWEKDVNPGHTLLLSDNGNFLLWSSPIIVSKSTFRCSCYGTNIDSKNIGNLLC